MNIKKILKLIILFLILTMTLSTVVFAENYTNPNQFDSYTTSGTSWQVVDKGINKTLGVVLSVLRTVAFCFAWIMLLVIGIKYLIAAPSVKAELKKDVPTYLVGVLMLFGAAGILQIITYLVNDSLGG